MENQALTEQFMTEVFDKAKEEAGSDVRNRVVNHIHSYLENTFLSSKHQPISVRTLERYHKVYVEKEEDVEGFAVPDEEFKYQLAKFIGYDNFTQYLAHYHRNESNSKTTYNNADIINSVENMKGNMNFHLPKKKKKTKSKDGNKGEDINNP